MDFENYVEVCKLVCSRVRQTLLDYVRGSVYVRVEHDVLKIWITHDDFKFIFETSDFLNKVHMGICVEDICNKCVETYKNAILRKYTKIPNAGDHKIDYIC